MTLCIVLVECDQGNWREERLEALESVHEFEYKEGELVFVDGADCCPFIVLCESHLTRRGLRRTLYHSKQRVVAREQSQIDFRAITRLCSVVEYSRSGTSELNALSPNMESQPQRFT
jgi:hypothetical protein